MYGVGRGLRVGAIAVAAALLPARGWAQQAVAGPVQAGGEYERYLRARQLTGDTPPIAWSIRGFSPDVLDSLVAGTTGGWQAAIQQPLKTSRFGSWSALPIRAGSIGNTGFPYGMNDGPVWAGRGITAFGEAGIAARKGIVSLTLNPMAFVAQNSGFALAEEGLSGVAAFSAPRLGRYLDVPQRFGDGAYASLTLGESQIRVDTRFVAAGFSSANEFWGPAVEHPIILGNNASGFLHAFIGSNRPFDLKIVRVAGRILWGRLDESGYTETGITGKHGMASAAVGVITLPAVPGLELGAIRFFHTPTPRGSFSLGPYLKVFEGILKESLVSIQDPDGNVSEDNQLASVFARLAFPGTGLEVYSEYGREDHNWNLRDFWLEPDHDAAILFGIQRAWESSGDKTSVVRMEHLNTRISHLQMVAPQAPWYVHGAAVASHAHRGQALGSIGGFGGGASSVAFDRYSPAGRVTVRWDRIMREESFTGVGMPTASAADVTHAIGVERLRMQPWGETALSLSAVYNFNRNFRGDQFSINSGASFRFFQRERRRGVTEAFK